MCDKTYQEGIQFFYHEAELLDDRRYQDWLQLLTDDVVYQIPIRLTREKAANNDFSSASWLMNETKSSLKMRVHRSYTDYDWAEDPPSRTRRFLTNFRIVKNDVNDEVLFKVNFLLFRGKFDEISPHLISGERHDTLRQVDGSWKLAKRLVYLDHTTVPMNNLSVFF